MKKRLTCLLLCLVMLLSLGLTACKDKTEDEVEDGITDAASASAKTLTMWIVSENEVSEKTAKEVNEALNDITKSKFKTQLIVKFLTEDVYEKTVSETIENYKKAKESGVVPEDVPTEETETLDNGMSVIKYPELVPYQVDIVYIAGEQMFLDYVDKGWLYALDEELNGSSKKIKEYISDTLLSAAKLDGTTYAIPNNNVIGEYTYMLLNKDLMDKYSQQGYVTLGEIDGFYNTYLFNYLKLIKLFEPDVVPVNASYEECLGLLGHYWSVDPSTYELLEDFSVFGHHYTDIESLSRGSVILGYNSLFENPEFTADYLKLNELKYDGYFNAEEGKNAAVKFVKGDSTVLEKYADEYYSVIVEYPTASADDIYSNMFGVCINSKSLDRSMQVITYLNTNTEFRNMLQYGVENKHYKLNVDEDTGKTSLERLTNEYMMDIYATGNAFLAYPEPDMSEDIWEKGKIQNRGSLVNPLLGFNIKDFAVSAGKTEEALTLEKTENYKISYSTGYSKDVLMQNDDLAKWIQSCDEEGKGIYLLKTSEVSGQYLNCNYYVYNSLIAGASEFKVTPVDYYNTVEDGDKEKEVFESVDLIFDYTEDPDAKAGYELSLVSFLTKKTTPYNVFCQNNGSEVEATPSELSKILKFDFLNTDEYSIELYANLSKTSVLKNKGLMAWLQDCDKQADSKRDPITFVKNYRNEATGEETYIVYQTGMEYITTMDFVPTGDKGELNLGFNYNVVEERDFALALNPKAELDQQDREYILYYVRVKPAEGVDLKISCNVTKNGAKTSVTKETATEDPDFVMFGNLDTELVKYMHQLNKELNDVINSCATYEELEAVVAEISLLLSTDSDVKLDQKSFVKLKDFIKNSVIAGDLETFREYLISATSTEIIKHVDKDDKEVHWEDPISKLDEAYVYYDSLYGIYYQWMEAYGFLPTEKQ
ncbi:MAG: hypothetical protein IJX19_07090 [Clostridia bacterium]|nr:hypothetical protein [Clostridia bacterium]